MTAAATQNEGPQTLARRGPDVRAYAVHAPGPPSGVPPCFSFGTWGTIIMPSREYSPHYTAPATRVITLLVSTYRRLWGCKVRGAFANVGADLGVEWARVERLYYREPGTGEVRLSEWDKIRRRAALTLRRAAEEHRRAADECDAQAVELEHEQLTLWEATWGHNGRGNCTV